MGTNLAVAALTHAVSIAAEFNTNVQLFVPLVEQFNTAVASLTTVQAAIPRIDGELRWLRGESRCAAPICSRGEEEK